MSYDLWAWAWADNNVEARPEEIVALPLAVETEAPEHIPGLREFIIAGRPHPALAPFDPALLLEQLKGALGRHFRLVGDKPSLLHMELQRDAQGRGWRLDFSIPADLVHHLLPVGLGRAFSSAGLVLYDAWQERIVRPGRPKTRVFEVGGPVVHVDYEPTWSAIETALSELEEGDFSILQNASGDYVQCAGGGDRMTVECRLWSARRFYHWVAGTQAEDASIHQVVGPNGAIEVHGYEVLTVDDCTRIFKRFFNSGARNDRYRWRDISASFG